MLHYFQDESQQKFPASLFQKFPGKLSRAFANYDPCSPQFTAAGTLLSHHFGIACAANMNG